MNKKDIKNYVIIEILRKFKHNEKLKYNEIYEKKWCSSSHFDYYLKKIINEELLEKENEFYKLSPEGFQYISEVDGKEIKIKKKPFICSFLLAINENNDFLINIRAKQPFINYFNIPGGKVDLGETTIECAIRELEEETGIKANNVKLKAIVEKMTYNQNNELIHHIIGYFYISREFEGNLIKNNEEGINKWININELKKNKRFPELDYFIPKFLENNKEILINTIKRKEKNGEIIDYEIL